MHSFNKEHSYSFRADASALGGYITEPVQKNIPTLAPVCLPAAGGFATARSEGFNLEEIVSCSSAYSLVTGRREPWEGKGDEANGAISTLLTTVVEDLNILEVVTARRIVAQISVTSPLDGGPQRISLAGSRFEDLRFFGRDFRLTLNSPLSNPKPAAGKPAAGDNGSSPFSASFQQAVDDQAKNLIDSLAKHADKDNAAAWAKDRYGSKIDKGAHRTAVERSRVVCSFVDKLEEFDKFDNSEKSEKSAKLQDLGVCSTYGHVVEIPGFGRIFLGELFVSRHSVQLVSIRAELGCPVKGVVTGPTASDSGGHGTGGDD